MPNVSLFNPVSKQVTSAFSSTAHVPSPPVDRVFSGHSLADLLPFVFFPLIPSENFRGSNRWRPHGFRMSRNHERTAIGDFWKINIDCRAQNPHFYAILMAMQALTTSAKISHDSTIQNFYCDVWEAAWKTWNLWKQRGGFLPLISPSEESIKLSHFFKL